MGSQVTPEQIVQQNLDFYNKRDIEGFISSFCEKISLYDFGSPQPRTKGLEAIQMLYSEMFKRSPDLHSSILNRIVFGNKVIDHESIVGRNGAEETLEIVMIYEIKNEKICKLTVIRK